MQGVEGAKGFQVNTPNTETYLRDVENEDILYIKSTDQFGRPNKLVRRSLGKEEIINSSANTIDTSDFVTTKQLNDILDEKLAVFVDKLQPKHQGGNRNNGSRRNRQNRPQEDTYEE